MEIEPLNFAVGLLVTVIVTLVVSLFFGWLWGNGSAWQEIHAKEDEAKAAAIIHELDKRLTKLEEVDKA